MSAAQSTLRSLVAALATVTALLGPVAHADPPPYRIGVLVPPIATSPLEVGLREGLRQLGYVEGRDIIIEERRSTTSLEQELRSLATDLANANVQLIVASGGLAARAVLTATKLPVVFAPVGDAVESGLATNLAKPDRNGTGVSIVASELIGKRLEVLCTLVPHARRIVFLGNSSAPLAAGVLAAAKQAAQTLRVKLIVLDARNADELNTVLQTLPKSGADGMVVTGDFSFLVHRTKIAEAVRKARLPAMFPVKEFHHSGVLMSYGPNLTELMRRAAVYVDKLLKGASPSDLPIEQVSKFDLVIDLRVARALKLRVPDALLLRADELLQ